MAKEGVIEFSGTVAELLPNAMFRVKLDNDHEVLAHTSGKIEKTESGAGGDRVNVEMTLMTLARAESHSGLSSRIFSRRQLHIEDGKILCHLAWRWFSCPSRSWFLPQHHRGASIFGTNRHPAGSCVCSGFG